MPGIKEKPIRFDSVLLVLSDRVGQQLTAEQVWATYVEEFSDGISQMTVRRYLAEMVRRNLIKRYWVKPVRSQRRKPYQRFGFIEHNAKGKRK